MKQLFTGVLIVFCCVCGISQISVGTITVAPAQSFPGGSVMIVCTATTNYSGSRVNKWQSVDHVQTRIRLFGCYSQSMLPALKAYRDTFFVSQLQAGLYSVQFSAYESYSDQSCQWAGQDSTFAQLMVQDNTVGLSAARGPEIKVYPNPSSGIFFIKGIASVASVKVYDLTGKEVLVTRAGSEDQIRINQRGLFLVVVEIGNEKLYRKLLVE